MTQITYSKAAIKVLRGMPANTARTIRSKMEAYLADPASQAANVIRLQGRTEYRLRVGSWRVIFAEDGQSVFVKVIRPRGGAYKE